MHHTGLSVTIAAMRILITGDLHYNITRSKQPTEAVARKICQDGGDVLLLLGDLAGTDLDVLEQVFELFEGFRGQRLFVAGNHDLWTPRGGDSLARYRDELPAVCRACGVHALDIAPWMNGDVAIAGTVGWYDYTFRPASMRIPLRFYQHKIAPGSASANPDFVHLLERRDDIPPEALDLACHWMDGEHIRMELSDVEFVRETLASLRGQLEQTSRAKTVVVGMHHLPLFELVPQVESAALRFANAFLGSELFGETILEFPNVRHVFCGHSHHYACCRRGPVTATSIGVTYKEKRYEVLEV